MESPSVAGPSQPISLSGTTVGQLDATQASRVLSVLEAKLSFASYDPYTAYADPPTLSAKDIPPKRIVIETLPNGRSTWRWVPRAKGVESIADEGSWPRIIDICGQQVLCSQEQWDIYKLDPAYDCTVHPAPHLTTITPRKSQDKRKASSDAGRGKRPKGYSSDEGSPKSPHAKKPRIHEADSDSDAEHTDSDDEVEDIILDDSERAWREAMKTARRERIQKRREERWEKNIVRNRKLQEAQDVSMIDLTADDEDSAQSSQPAFK
ncbi:hypothetical protein NM688_g6579 [Phlebia brevispora]|uniref:Uncharacterized protein n=1 Tax=Phlebia brevispora TaxID=194682 RepID=A0ACC1SEH2_9APHY|nr:hypothetical protein NM688_g6579 [Phlebia brevispora]